MHTLHYCYTSLFWVCKHENTPHTKAASRICNDKINALVFNPCDDLKSSHLGAWN